MIRFWEESKGKQSSKRLAFLGVMGMGVILSAVYLFIKWDYVGTVAIITGFSTAGISLMAIGKKQENDAAKIK